MDAPETRPAESGKTLKEQFVPFEQRESQQPKTASFIYDMVKLLVVAKLSALAGGFLGQMMHDKSAGKALANLRNLNFSNKAIWGKTIGGLSGAMYELHDHWRKEEGNRLGAKCVNENIRSVVNVEHVRDDARKQEAFLQDLQKLEAALEERAQQPGKTSHAQRLASRREEADAVKATRL